MRIMIVGAGAVGVHLAKLLTREHLDICLMDSDAEKLRDLDANYDIMTRVGQPLSLRDLRDTDTANTDLFIAVTPDEAVNMSACILAAKLGAKKVIARIDNYEYVLPQNKEFFKELGLSHLIYPEVLAANEIAEALRTNWMRKHILLCEDKLHLCVIKVRANAAIVNRTFASGYFNHSRYRVVALKRGTKTIIPRGEDQILPEDLVYFVCTDENIDFVREQAGKDVREIKNVTFFGGTKIAQKAAQTLGKDFNIKILEEDRELCYQLSEKLDNALIINISMNDTEALRREGLEDADAFVAVTENAEQNIFACLAARKAGVYKTIAEVENIDFIPLAEELDIASVINKKTIAASYIYQLLLNAAVLNVKNLTTADAEIVEFQVTEGSRVTRHQIKDLDLPRDVNIGALVRADEPILVNGQTQLVKNDKVIVFCKSDAIRKLEKYFK